MNIPDSPDPDHPAERLDDVIVEEWPERRPPADLIQAHFEPLNGTPGLLGVAEALLKEPGRVIFELSRGRAAPVTLLMLLIAGVCLTGYGLTVGVFSGGDQLWAAPAKHDAGALLTILICFPSLAIFSCLAGATTKLREVFGALVSVVALYSILLLGFGPVSWVFSQATDSVACMGVIHLLFWIIGLYYGCRLLFGTFGFLDGRNTRHLGVWTVIFLVVSLQMTTYLRPIVGSSEKLLTSEKKFFLAHWAETIQSSTTDKREELGD